MNNRMQIPILGQHLSQEQLAKAQVIQAIGEMASSMYVQLATAHIATLDTGLHEECDREQLRNLAKTCKKAAVAFFEGLGVIALQPIDNGASGEP